MQLNLQGSKNAGHAQTARFTLRGFKVDEDKVYLAKIGLLKVVWSRPLPGEPSIVGAIRESPLLDTS